MADDIGLGPPNGWQGCGAPYPRFPQAASIRILEVMSIERVTLVPVLPIYSRSSACSLPRTSSPHDGEEVFRALRAAAAAFKVGPLLDRKRHMTYVTVNLR